MINPRGVRILKACQTSNIPIQVVRKSYISVLTWVASQYRSYLGQLGTSGHSASLTVRTPEPGGGDNNR